MTRVKATRRGFYGSLREVGDEFGVTDDKHLSAKWMERVDGKPIKGKAKAEPKAEAPKGDGKRKGAASAEARAKLAEGDTGEGAGEGSSDSNDTSGSDAGDTGNPDG